MLEPKIGSRVTGIGEDIFENHTVIAKGRDCVVLISDNEELGYLFKGEPYVVGVTVFVGDGYRII